MIGDAVAVVKGDTTPELFNALRESKKIAWDIETSGLDWRSERIGVCQLYTPHTGTIVVQLGSRRPNNLCSLLEDSDVLKVFHHAPFDLRFMHHHWGVRSRNLACTKIASKLLTPQAPNEDHSLRELLRRHLTVSIDKEEQTSNWMAKHLSAAQLAYAATDVCHLLPLLDALLKKLEAVGLHRLYSECLRHVPTRVELDLLGYDDVFAY
jgi:ribonuclease D